MATCWWRKDRSTRRSTGWRKTGGTAEWGYSENNRRAKYYELSRTGRLQLRDEMTSWERYARAIGKALAAATPTPA